jgi:ubiquinone/menaquinone biosynthesis C-methylase UbiE
MDIHITHNHSRMNEDLLSTFFEVETKHWWWVARKKIVVNLLQKYVKNKNNLILDAGCGTGAGMLYLQEFGKVYGVDLSQKAVNYCKKRGITRVKLGDVSNLPYKDNFFDIICLMDVIEHVSNDKLVIREMHRVLKKGGLLLMTLPALPFIYSKHDKAQGHFKRYSKNDLAKIFKGSGFKEKKMSYFNIFLSPLIIAIRLLSKAGGPLEKLADFDSKVNYDIFKRRVTNFVLCQIFSIESKLLVNMDLPFGISLLSIHKKI